MIAEIPKKYICPKCKKEIKRFALPDGRVEKWVCKEHGSIRKALTSIK